MSLFVDLTLQGRERALPSPYSGSQGTHSLLFQVTFPERSSILAGRQTKADSLVTSQVPLGSCVIKLRSAVRGGGALPGSRRASLPLGPQLILMM